MSAEDLEKYETEMELQLYREYRDVVKLFTHVVETERRFYLANNVDVKVRSDGGEVYFEVTMQDAWVWDVYDANQQRALRLSGEEPAGKAGRDAWATADDLILRKIAQAGFSGLSAMINGTPAETPPVPGRRGPVVASAEQTAPAVDAFAAASLSYSGH